MIGWELGRDEVVERREEKTSPEWMGGRDKWKKQSSGDCDNGFETAVHPILVL